LAWAVESVIDQSLPPHRVTIIGDGATPEVRKVATELSEKHSVVEFLDKPKLKNRGERYRDEVIKASDADFISYLCDDDLFMPHHLETMAQHLKDYDFVHPRPTFVNPDGTFFFIPSGIESLRIKAWHKLVPPQNSISLTGASHTRYAYLALENGWDAGPPDVWTDLNMWVKFFANEGISTFTSDQTTTIKLMHSRSDRDLLTRQQTVEMWYETTRQPDKLASFQMTVETQFRELQFDNSLELIKLSSIIPERDALIIERDSLRAERNQMLSSKSWRLTRPLRRLNRVFRKIVDKFSGRENS
jgi:hypothetical protein